MDCIEGISMKSTHWSRGPAVNLACIFWIGLLVTTASQAVLAQEASTSGHNDTQVAQQFGGASSVPGQLADDERLTESLTGKTFGQDYFDWKSTVREKHGLNFTLDYTAGFLGATNTMGAEDSFMGGAARFFGTWDLVGRDSGNTGSFVFKIEHRHGYSDLPPSATASQIGYVGLILPVLSDIKTRLTNLYWKQNLKQGNVEIITGMIDTTDWVDVYALASPWNGFFNFALATGGASIPVPDDAALVSV